MLYCLLLFSMYHASFLDAWKRRDSGIIGSTTRERNIENADDVTVLTSLEESVQNNARARKNDEVIFSYRVACVSVFTVCLVLILDSINLFILLRHENLAKEFIHESLRYVDVSSTQQLAFQCTANSEEMGLVDSNTSLVVLIPDAFGQPLDFFHLIAAFHEFKDFDSTEDIVLCSYDRRESLDSFPTAEKITETLSRDLRRLESSLGVERASVFLVGHGMGAVYASLFAAASTGKVAGLILVDPPELSLIPGESTEAYFLPENQDQMQFLLLFGVPRLHTLSRLFGSSGLQPELSEAIGLLPRELHDLYLLRSYSPSHLKLAVREAETMKRTLALFEELTLGSLDVAVVIPEGGLYQADVGAGFNLAERLSDRASTIRVTGEDVTHSSVLMQKQFAEVLLFLLRSQLS